MCSEARFTPLFKNESVERFGCSRRVRSRESIATLSPVPTPNLPLYLHPVSQLTPNSILVIPPHSINCTLALYSSFRPLTQSHVHLANNRNSKRIGGYFLIHIVLIVVFTKAPPRCACASTATLFHKK